MTDTTLNGTSIAQDAMQGDGYDRGRLNGHDYNRGFRSGFAGSCAGTDTERRAGLAAAKPTDGPTVERHQDVAVSDWAGDDQEVVEVKSPKVSPGPVKLQSCRSPRARPALVTQYQVVGFDTGASRAKGVHELPGVPSYTRPAFPPRPSCSSWRITSSLPFRPTFPRRPRVRRFDEHPSKP